MEECGGLPSAIAFCVRKLRYCVKKAKWCCSAQNKILFDFSSIYTTSSKSEISLFFVLSELSLSDESSESGLSKTRIKHRLTVYCERKIIHQLKYCEGGDELASALNPMKESSIIMRDTAHPNMSIVTLGPLRFSNKIFLPSSDFSFVLRGPRGHQLATPLSSLIVLRPQ